MKIFLDDCRYEPNGWELVNTVPELEKLFLSHRDEVTYISLDNSLGVGNKQGKAFVDDLINNQWFVPNLWIHSSDFIAVDYMKEQLEIAQRGNVISKEIKVKIVNYPTDFTDII